MCLRSELKRSKSRTLRPEFREGEPQVLVGDLHSIRSKACSDRPLDRHQSRLAANCRELGTGPSSG